MKEKIGMSNQKKFKTKKCSRCLNYKDTPFFIKGKYYCTQCQSAMLDEEFKYQDLTKLPLNERVLLKVGHKGFVLFDRLLKNWSKPKCRRMLESVGIILNNKDELDQLHKKWDTLTSYNKVNITKVFTKTNQIIAFKTIIDLIIENRKMKENS
jgi:hypothetical protein